MIPSARHVKELDVQDGRDQEVCRTLTNRSQPATISTGVFLKTVTNTAAQRDFVLFRFSFEFYVLVLKLHRWQVLAGRGFRNRKFCALVKYLSYFETYVFSVS